MASDTAHDHVHPVPGGGYRRDAHAETHTNGRDDIRDATNFLKGISRFAPADFKLAAGSVSLALLDNDSSHRLSFDLNTNLTANRTLTLVTSDTDQTITVPAGDYTLAGRQLANTFTALQTFSSAGTSIEVAESVGHQFDANTLHKFTPDMQEFICGGVSLLQLIESTVDEVRIGNGSGADYLQVTSQGKATFVGSRSGIPYAEISAIDAADTIAIAAAGKANKVLVTSFTTNGPSNNMTADQANDRITVVKAGHYECIVSLHIESAVAGPGDEYGFSLWIDNGTTELTNVHAHQKLAGGGGDVATVSLSGFVNLDAADEVRLYAWNEDSAADVVIEDVTMSLKQIGGA